MLILICSSILAVFSLALFFKFLKADGTFDDYLTDFNLLNSYRSAAAFFVAKYGIFSRISFSNFTGDFTLMSRKQVKREEIEDKVRKRSFPCLYC